MEGVAWTPSCCSRLLPARFPQPCLIHQHLKGISVLSCRQLHHTIASATPLTQLQCQLWWTKHRDMSIWMLAHSIGKSWSSPLILGITLIATEDLARTITGLWNPTLCLGSKANKSILLKFCLKSSCSPATRLYKAELCKLLELIPLHNQCYWINKMVPNLAIFSKSFTILSICLKKTLAPKGIVACKFQGFFRASVNKQKNKNKNRLFLKKPYNFYTKLIISQNLIHDFWALIVSITINITAQNFPSKDASFTEKQIDVQYLTWKLVWPFIFIWILFFFLSSSNLNKTQDCWETAKWSSGETSWSLGSFFWDCKQIFFIGFCSAVYFLSLFYITLPLLIGVMRQNSLLFERHWDTSVMNILEFSLTNCKTI